MNDILHLATTKELEETRRCAAEDTFTSIPAMPVEEENKPIMLCLLDEVKQAFRPASVTTYFSCPTRLLENAQHHDMFSYAITTSFTCTMPYASIYIYIDKTSCFLSSVHIHP